ncbi:MAG: hypothetical protein O2894_08575 [Planctomycetota bacterium]|nr:hypothetical protein [Planctomycetota bacterium]
MAVSPEVRQYYAEKIFAAMGPGRVPESFRPLATPPTGFATVEGCRGGGKNLTEFALIGSEGTVLEASAACGLCNPAMYVAADILIRWIRGRSLAEILALDPRDVSALAPFFEALGGRRWPDDAREKFQYALAGVQNAVRNHAGEPALPVPEFDEPSSRDWADPTDE